jgi:hypothetical protein
MKHPEVEENLPGFQLAGLFLCPRTSQFTKTTVPAF